MAGIPGYDYDPLDDYDLEDLEYERTCDELTEEAEDTWADYQHERSLEERYFECR